MSRFCYNVNNGGDDGKERIAVKKYVVRLSKEEHAQLEELIGKGTSPAKQQLPARILLKADVSTEGEGWSDSQLIRALNTSGSVPDGGVGAVGKWPVPA